MSDPEYIHSETEDRGPETIHIVADTGTRDRDTKHEMQPKPKTVSEPITESKTKTKPHCPWLAASAGTPLLSSTALKIGACGLLTDWLGAESTRKWRHIVIVQARSDVPCYEMLADRGIGLEQPDETVVIPRSNSDVNSVVESH